MTGQPNDYCARGYVQRVQCTVLFTLRSYHLETIKSYGKCWTAGASGQRTALPVCSLKIIELITFTIIHTIKFRAPFVAFAKHLFRRGSEAVTSVRICAHNKRIEFFTNLSLDQLQDPNNSLPLQSLITCTSISHFGFPRCFLLSCILWKNVLGTENAIYSERWSAKILRRNKNTRYKRTNKSFSFLVFSGQFHLILGSSGHKPPMLKLTTSLINLGIQPFSECVTWLSSFVLRLVWMLERIFEFGFLQYLLHPFVIKYGSLNL